MCKLFPRALIEAIATAKAPTADAIEVVATHIKRDWMVAGYRPDATPEELVIVCRELALTAIIGSGDRRSADQDIPVCKAVDGTTY